jgi:hypothetical protein
MSKRRDPTTALHRTTTRKSQKTRGNVANTSGSRISSAAPTTISTDMSKVGDGEDSMSDLQTGESVTKNTSGPANDSDWGKMMERMKTMEDVINGGGVSVVSGDKKVTPPTNERITKENLRKFVTGKVFPSWKFIFKKEELQKCVVSAINKGYITVPPGYEDCQLAKHYSPTVRACLDGCRANAQSAARKRYLSK